MKTLSVDESDSYLRRIGMRVGKWNQLEPDSNTKPNWVSYRCPDLAGELCVFSQHASGWISGGDWTIFQIDNSTSLDPAQANLVNRLLFGSEGSRNIVEDRTYLFEFGPDKNSSGSTELLLANLIAVFLLFRAHAYLVSSSYAHDGRFLAVQDGFVYFFSAKELSGAGSPLKDFEKEPLRSPKWVLEFVAEND